MKGMFQTTLHTRNGNTKVTWVYVVDGDRPEPLLGEEDAEDLGVIIFNPDGGETIKKVETLESRDERGK